MELEKLRYPIGRFVSPENTTPEIRRNWIEDIKILPTKVRMVAEQMTETQLEIPYREGGWTARQVVHHLTDSHMNAYIRFHLTLTEDKPEIRPYFEDRWAELPDGRSGPVSVSLDLISALHARWCLLLKALDEDQWKRTYYHPEHGSHMALYEAAAMYAWHGNHHLGHLKLAAGKT